MQFLDRYLTYFLICFFLLLVQWTGFLYVTEQKTTEWNYYFNVAYAFMYIFGGLIALYGTKLHGLRSSVGRETFAIAIGMFGFAIGLFIWAFYNLVLKIETPFPSLADLFFILYIPFIAYGIINLLREFGLFFSKKILLESIGIFLLSAVLIFVFANPPDLAISTPLLEKVLNSAYLLGDSFLITLGIMLIRLTEGRIHKSFYFFVAALFVMAVADFIFAYRTSTDTYWNGDISDLLFATSGFLFSLGVTKIVIVQLKILRGMRSVN